MKSENEWIPEIENYKTYFSPQQQEFIDLFGLEVYLKAHEHFGKTSFYFSDAPITALKKAWAIKNKHIPYNEAARILNVTVSSIYNWRSKINKDNFELFEKRDNNEAKTK
jgi:hypothetical protein